MSSLRTKAACDRSAVFDLHLAELQRIDRECREAHETFMRESRETRKFLREHLA